MDKDTLFLVLGASLGFASALALEFARHWLAQKRSISDERISNQIKAKEQLTEFLSADNEQKSPAWVAIKKTPKPSLFSFLDGPTDFDTYDSKNKILKNLSNPNEKYIMQDIMIVGRDSRCEIQIRDKKVSRKHALIRFEKDFYAIYDLGSINGIFINEKRIADGEGLALKNADIIRIGDTQFQFGTVQPPSSETKGLISLSEVGEEEDNNITIS
jgi:hypothetical protein